MIPAHLVLNAGSSSLKFQVFEAESCEAGGRETRGVEDTVEPGAAGTPRLLYRGQVEGLGGAPHFAVRDRDGATVADERPDGEGFGHEAALLHLAAWLRAHRGGHRLAAVGHRVVHGGTAYDAPVRVDDAVVRDLERLVPLAPLHQPHNLEPIRVVRRRFPELPQVACFDTAFHRGQPEVAQLFALPAEITARGVRRYGFHGLSYAFVASALHERAPALAEGRTVVAHLGSGASLCALHRGRSVATTMGFSALDGLPMGTRCGALDPGVVFFLLRETGLEPHEAERMLYTRSGLLGVSGLSNDMRTLRAHAAGDSGAREAIDLFVYRIGRELGSLVAALGGIDGLVFTGGIGENDAATRAEVLRGAAWAGFRLDEAANEAGGPLITRGPGPQALVIPTDEEAMIARGMRAVLAPPSRPAP